MNRKNFIDKTFITNNSAETQRLGYDFARVLKRGDIICLYGELGGGKTTFVQGLAQGLGINNRIISPTFTIVRSYLSKNKKSKIKNKNDKSKCKNLERDMFYHVDLYRIEKEKELEGLGIEEILDNKNNIVAIEWADKLKSFCPKKRIDVKFFYRAESARRIVFRFLNQ